MTSAEVVPLPHGDHQPLVLARRALAALNAIYDERHENHGLNQQDVADAMGRPQSYVSRVLTGAKRHLKMDDIENFIRAYGISLDELLERGSRELEKADTPRITLNTGANTSTYAERNDDNVLPFQRPDQPKRPKNGRHSRLNGWRGCAEGVSHAIGC